MRLIGKILALLLPFLAACSRVPQVAIISQSDPLEQQSMTEMIAAAGFECTVVGIDADFSDFDLVWYHRPDTSALSKEEMELGQRIVPYVQGGGHLVLSMDAVRLSNAWGLEDNPVDIWTQEAIDEGFGRKVGYHSHRSHPLFDGLYGGAYVWHGCEDNTNRVLGYNGDNMPAADNTDIIATLWEYIFYQPSLKVVWEQKLGKGSILSIGCLLYYSKPNFHKAILERFTANVVRYMGGVKSSTPEKFWQYQPSEVVFDDAAALFRASKASAPERWNIPEDGDALRFGATRSELTLPSRRVMLVAEETSGIREIWTHPFMSLRDYEIAVTLPGGGTLRLSEPSEEVELRFNSLIRNYSVGNVSIREVIVPSMDNSSVVVHYDWDGEIDKLSVSFSSNMRYMWPYDENALGSLHCGWSEDKGCYAVCADENEFVSLLGSNLPGRLVSQEADKDLLLARVSLEFDASGREACDVVMAAGNEGLPKVAKAYDTALRAPRKVFDRSAAYWTAYLDKTVSIQTPDEYFNEGYRWAMVSAGQFLAETPGVGSGLMAGYSSSRRGWGGGHRVSGRPGYAWYFGRDSELSALAFLSMGDFEAVRQTLELLAAYQGANGPIFHELSTSGSDHFDASDSTPLFVVLMAEYVRATGDVKFLRDHIENVYKAMDFSWSTDTDGDHLIEIQHVGHGWLEGGDYFKLGTEYYLSGIWARALEDAALLAGLVGDESGKEKFASEFKIVRAEIENFWNEEKGYYNYAKGPDGEYSTAFLALPSVPVWLGMADPDRAYAMVKGYAGADFSTDWGVRQTSDPRPEEGVGTYDESNIWPLFTGSVSLAEYAVGRYNQGFEHMMSSLLCYLGATHGRVPEVLRGNSYRSGGITRHQCWSETAVTGPAIQGMLGFRADALANEVVLSPRLPFDWKTVKVSNLPCGKTRVGLSMDKDDTSVRYCLSTNKGVNVQFAPAFPPASVINSVEVNGRPVEFSVEEGREYTVLNTTFRLDEKAEVTVGIDEAASSLPVYFICEDNAETSGIRVLSQEVLDGNLQVRVEGRPGTSFDFPVYDGGKVVTETVDFIENTENVIIL